MLALESREQEFELSYKKIDAINIDIFRQQNSIFFPITYPESFYRAVLNSPETSAYLVFINETCIGSISTRLEPLTRWYGIREGKTVDNFNPANCKNGEPKMCYIMTLGVLPSFRFMGLGSRILEKIIENAKCDGILTIGLHVHVENYSALKFYSGKGFKVIGQVKDYYRRITPNCAYVLELEMAS